MLKYPQKSSVWVFVGLKLPLNTNFEKRQNITLIISRKSCWKTARKWDWDIRTETWSVNYEVLQYLRKGRTRNIHFICKCWYFSKFLFYFALSIHLSWSWQFIHIQNLNDIISLLVNVTIPCQILGRDISISLKLFIKPTKQPDN